MDSPLRLMTYNVHSCVGRDRKLDPERIAEVIAESKPDIIALQELDLKRRRSGHIDQAAVIASYLRMEFHFHPALRVEDELYGDAVLSRWPMNLRRAAELPTARSILAFEPRGALWITIDSPAGPLQVINSHLGLSRLERHAQMQALLSSEWADSPLCSGPKIICGDFNALPSSGVLRRATTTGWRDVQRCLPGHRPLSTFPSNYPVLRIDHVLVSPELVVRKVIVPTTPAARTASDHLPLVVDFSLNSQTPLNEGFTFPRDSSN